MTELRIIPAVIPTSYKDVEDTLIKVGFFSESVQIDLVDGMFVPFSSWPFKEKSDDALEEFKRLRAITSKYDVEIDAMVSNPEQYLETWIESGVNRIIIHVESTLKLAEIIGMDRKGLTLGLSLNNDTSLSTLEPHLVTQIDFIQVMGIAQIGAQGQPFDERVLERIKALHMQYPGLPISIDGSVNETTLPLLREAGATRFVVGSAILLAPEPHTAYESLSKLLL